MQSRNEGAEGPLLFVGATYLYYLSTMISILVVIVADTELLQPHYDSTLPFKEGSALILLSVSDVLA